MTDRKLMQQALEALAAADDFLFNYHECEPNHEREMDAYSAIRANNHAAFTALRSRLAQPEQEPFALLVRKHSWNEGQYECAPPNAPEYGRQWADERVLVYTSPPQRKPLTDEDTVALIKQCRDAFAEELGAWDIEPPIHHVQQGYDNCVNWLAAHGIKGEA